MAAQETPSVDAYVPPGEQPQSIYAQQGKSHDFSGADDAYGARGLAGGSSATSAGRGEDNRTATLSLGGKTLTLSLHQPIYRNMQDKPAIFFKIMNMIVAVLLCISAIYRFFASFSGHIVIVRCKNDIINDLVDASGEGQIQVECKDVLKHVEASPDGFELFVQSCFIIVFTSINVLEEFDYRRVAGVIDTYVNFMSSLIFRGLYLLFIASLVMTASHSFLLFSGALAMTVAFLYILLWGLSHFTSHGSRLGVQSYNPQPPDDFEAPLPGGLQGQSHQVAT